MPRMGRESERSRFDKAQRRTSRSDSSHKDSDEYLTFHPMAAAVCAAVRSMSRMDDALRLRICIADESWILHIAIPR